MGFNDEGLGAAMGLSQAQSTADIASLNADDARAICTWLNERLNAVEAALGIKSGPCPELPSETKLKHRLQSYTNSNTQHFYGKA